MIQRSDPYGSKRGRPSKYRPEYAGQAGKLCRLGATDADLSDFFEVDERTINRWKCKHSDFCQSLRPGKEEADSRVERGLYQRALGYSHDAVKILIADKEPISVDYREHYPPDTTACIFWLKNRRPDLWRDVHRQEHTGANGDPISVFRAEFDRQG